MDAATIEHRKRVSRLEDELANFRSMMEYVNWIPDEVSLANIEVFGQTFPLNGILGGDHIILVDFKRRHNLEARIERARRDGREDVARRLAECNDRVGVLLADSTRPFSPVSSTNSRPTATSRRSSSTPSTPASKSRQASASSSR